MSLGPTGLHHLPTIGTIGKWCKGKFHDFTSLYSEFSPNLWAVGRKPSIFRGVHRTGASGEKERAQRSPRQMPGAEDPEMGGVSINWGTPKWMGMDGLARKIPLEWMRTRGSPMLGNSQMEILPAKHWENWRKSDSSKDSRMTPENHDFTATRDFHELCKDFGNLSNWSS